MQITSNLNALEQARPTSAAAPTAPVAPSESGDSAPADAAANQEYLQGAGGDVQNLQMIRPFPIIQKDVKVAFQMNIKGRNVRVEATAKEEGENLPGNFPFPRPGYNSRLFSFQLDGKDLQEVAPKAVGQSFALDCPRGLDARLALIEAGRSIVDDISQNGGNLGYEAPTGARVREDEQGDLQAHLEGGKSGIDITKPGFPIRPTPFGSAQ